MHQQLLLPETDDIASAVGCDASMRPSVAANLRPCTGGSSGWQAPEQLLQQRGGLSQQGRRMDIFPFGLLLYWCLSGGQHPHGDPYERDYNILQARLCLQNVVMAQQAPFLDHQQGARMPGDDACLPATNYKRVKQRHARRCSKRASLRQLHGANSSVSKQLWANMLPEHASSVFQPSSIPQPSAAGCMEWAGSLTSTSFLQGRLDMGALSSQPIAGSLVHAMLQQQPADRPSIAAVMQHPFWWPPAKRLMFLIDLSNRMETEDREASCTAGLHKQHGASASWITLHMLLAFISCS